MINIPGQLGIRTISPVMETSMSVGFQPQSVSSSSKTHFLISTAKVNTEATF